MYGALKVIINSRY